MGRGYKSISKLSIVLRRALLLVLLCCAAALGSATAHAQSASAWNKRGQEAEARQNYDAAMDDYHQAVLKNPSDLRYKTRYEHTRFLASVGHVDRGRVLRQSGDLTGALAEFKRALQIDSSNQTAQQEIDQVQQVLDNPQASATPERNEQMSRQNETLDTIGSISGPVELKPVSNDPITLHMVEDVKVIYQAIGKAAGLNVLFDPDYTSKRIPVDLTNVSLTDALRIVGTHRRHLLQSPSPPTPSSSPRTPAPSAPISMSRPSRPST